MGKMNSFFIKIGNKRAGKLRFEFFQLEIFKFLLEELGFNYIKINGKGKFLKSIPGGYKIVHFQSLRDEFTEYLRQNYDSQNLPNGISYEDYMDKYYRTMPITRTYARSFFQIESRLNENDFVMDGEYLKFKQ